MIITDLSKLAGRFYPARRRTQNVVGGAAPIQAENFSVGYVTLEPRGGQVPWHNQEQEEVYLVLDGVAEMCLGEEVAELRPGMAAYIPHRVFHQISNKGDTQLHMLYIYGPAGTVAHWKQELEGTLPKAGEGDTPPLPKDAKFPQCTDKPAE